MSEKEEERKKKERAKEEERKEKEKERKRARTDTRLSDGRRFRVVYARVYKVYQKPSVGRVSS